MYQLKRYMYKGAIFILRKDLSWIWRKQYKELTFSEFLSYLIDYFGFKTFDIIKNVYIFY